MGLKLLKDKYVVPGWEYGWIILRFMWFEKHLNCFLKLESHILVLWLFCRISVISEFSFLGIGLKTKTRIPAFFPKIYQIHLCVCLSLILLAEFVILFSTFSVISCFLGFPSFHPALEYFTLKSTRRTEQAGWLLFTLVRQRINS